jgi:nitrogen fixation protein
MANKKISQLTSKSANLAATDLVEISEVSGLTYVSKKITGQEIIGGVASSIIEDSITNGVVNKAPSENAVFDALALKVPYTGATGDVDLGEYELKAGQIELDQSPTGTAGVAVTRWNNTIGSTETTLKGGLVVLKNGVDLVARVVNKVTPNATLTKAAYQVVRVSGAQGQRLAVAYAQANNDNNSADTLGVVIETIATNQEGFIMTVGQLDDINTSGSLQGETWADGDVLYLSPTVPGAVTKVKPTGATGHIVIIGYVEYAHAVNGKIYVKIMNGWELDELHNVYINSGTLANNDALIYESSTQLWKNKTIATALGYTPVTNARTINTTAPLSGGGDLSADRTLSISDAAADGTTKGAATFTANDFNSASGVISLDYANGQKASGSQDGFLSSANWTDFNNKVSTGAITGSGLTMATSRLLGRTTASSGAVEELSVGTGLTLSGGTLSAALPIEIQVACSDETTALTTGAGKVTFRTPCAMTVTAVRASLTTAQSSGNIFTVDINEGNTSILSTKLTIDNTEKTSTAAATPPVISDNSLADDAEITVDIDQIGDGTAKGLKVTIIGTRV